MWTTESRFFHDLVATLRFARFSIPENLHLRDQLFHGRSKIHALIPHHHTWHKLILGRVNGRAYSIAASLLDLNSRPRHRMEVGSTLDCHDRIFNAPTMLIYDEVF